MEAGALKNPVLRARRNRTDRIGDPLLRGLSGLAAAVAVVVVLGIVYEVAHLAWPAIQEFGKKYEAKYKSKPDHNGVKGYIAPYMIKAAAEKAGKLDGKAIAAALHGMTITPDKVPGILIEATWDDTGEIDRISFLGEVKDGKQVITETLPKLKK